MVESHNTDAPADPRLVQLAQLLRDILGDQIRQIVRQEMIAARVERRHVPGEPIDGRTLAILTAAATAALGRPAQVRSVTFLNPHTVSAWAESGRVQIHGARNIPRGSR